MEEYSMGDPKESSSAHTARVPYNLLHLPSSTPAKIKPIPSLNPSTTAPLLNYDPHKRLLCSTSPTLHALDATRNASTTTIQQEPLLLVSGAWEPGSLY
jgi:hypothetical protein